MPLPPRCVEAERRMETGEEKVILFNLSGHGLIDMASYDKYFSGDLVDHELTDDDVRRNLMKSDIRVPMAREMMADRLPFY